MRVFGYDRNEDSDEPKLRDICYASICASPEQLRDLADFLNATAKKMEIAGDIFTSEEMRLPQSNQLGSIRVENPARFNWHITNPRIRIDIIELAKLHCEKISNSVVDWLLENDVDEYHITMQADSYNGITIEAQGKVALDRHWLDHGNCIAFDYAPDLHVDQKQLASVIVTTLRQDKKWPEWGPSYVWFNESDQGFEL